MEFAVWGALHGMIYHCRSFKSAYVQDLQTVNDGVAHSKNPRKCAYHVTFDLDLDLDFEHTLDAR